MKTLSLLFAFYLRFLPFSLGITIVQLVAFYHNGLSSFAPLFWVKILCSAGIYSLVNGMIKRNYFYYRNLGWSPRELWGYTLGFDFLIFITGIIVIANVQA